MNMISKSDSVKDMLDDMSFWQRDILRKHFNDDRSRMSRHYQDILESEFNEDSLVPMFHPSYLKKDKSVKEFEETKDKVEVKLNLEGFKPDEIVIKTVDNLITIEAKHEENIEGKIASRQYNRKFTLPSSVDPEKIVSSLSKNNLLTISAPKTQIEDKKSTSEQKQEASKTTMKDSDDPIREMLDRMTNRHHNVLETDFKGNSEAMFREYDQIFEKHFDNDPFRPLFSRSISRIRQRPKIFENDKEFEIQLDVQGFSPNNISVKTENNCLIIEAKQDNKDFLSFDRDLCKTYRLPPDVDPQKITSTLAHERQLIVKVPKKEIIPSRRTVPIKVLE